MRKAPKQKILVVTAFQFLQIEDVSRCAQLLSVQLSKIHEHGIETIFKHVANLLLCRSAQYLYLQCVYDSDNDYFNSGELVTSWCFVVVK